jgi:hypothetical protein
MAEQKVARGGEALTKSKQAYRKPEVVRYGHVADVTKSGGSGPQDFGGTKKIGG